MAKAISEVGLATPDGLEIVAKIWRPVSMTPEFHVDDLRELNRVFGRSYQVAIELMQEAGVELRLFAEPTRT